MLVVYEVSLVYEPSGGTCIYSPAFVWDDVTAIVYTYMYMYTYSRVGCMEIKFCVPLVEACTIALDDVLELAC